MKLIIGNHSGYRVDRHLINRAIRKTIKRLKIKQDIGLFFVTKRKIRQLNKEFRHIDKATDVLSFEMQEGNYLGDIIVSPEVAKVSSKEYKIGYNDEIVKLVIHGILHLLGSDHRSKKDSAKMFKLQSRLIKGVVCR